MRFVKVRKKNDRLKKAKILNNEKLEKKDKADVRNRLLNILL